MAKNNCKVLLGYEDDWITDKQKHFIDFTTNKVGGKPDWPNSEIYVPPCPLCAGGRRLIIQLYVPLENSSFHRTIYLFSCLNPPCSNQSQGWLCIRTQVLEKNYEKESKVKSSAKQSKPAEKIEWCTGADDWGDAPEDDFSLDTNTNSNEENGNVIESVQKCDNRMSDEDDESNSFGSDPIPGFNNLGIDDRNANNGANAIAGAYAIEKQVPSPNRPTAEIEGAESEVILIDAPPAPQKEIISLLKNATVFNAIPQDQALKSFFIADDEEQQCSKIASAMSEHVRELMVEYEMRDDTIRTSPDDPNAGAACNNMDEHGEQYERGIPCHGDLMYHHFLTRIQENPGQILRYSREAAPLLIAPLKENVQKCQNCGGDVICELQVLPTLIPKLQFENGEAVPIDFGNVLVYTCLKSCWDTPDRMRLESVIVQQEEMPEMQH